MDDEQLIRGIGRPTQTLFLTFFYRNFCCQWSKSFYSNSLTTFDQIRSCRLKPERRLVSFVAQKMSESQGQSHQPHSHTQTTHSEQKPLDILFQTAMFDGIVKVMSFQNW